MAVCKEGVSFGTNLVNRLGKGIEQLKKKGKYTNQGIKEMMVEGYINQILSGGKTMVVNPLTTVLKATQMGVERYGAAAVNKVMGREGANWDDANRFAGSLITELGDAMKMFKHTMRTGVPAYKGTKIEDIGITRAITADNLEHTTLSWMVNGDRSRATINAIGLMTNMTGRLLMAQDDAAKAWIGVAELKYAAGIIAREKASAPLMGLQKGTKQWQEGVDEIYNGLLKNPEKSPRLQGMIDTAQKEGTFTTDYAKGSLMDHLAKGTRQFTPLRFLIPFTKVPNNIISEGFQSTFAAQALSPALWRKLLSEDPIVRQIAHGKLLLSNTIAAGVMALTVSNGMINIGGPGPADRKLRADRIRMGKYPNHLNLDLDGDGHYEHNFNLDRLQPFSAIISNAAAFAEFFPYISEGEYQEYIQAVTLTIMSNLTDHPMMGGAQKIGDLITAMGQADFKAFEDVLGTQAVSAIPVVGATMLKDIAHAIDPQKRAIEGMNILDTLLKKIQARLPFVSKGLALDYDMWGDSISYDPGMTPDMLGNWVASVAGIFTPIEHQTISPTRGFLRDQLLVNEVSFEAPSTGEFGFDMNPMEKSEFSRYLGGGIPPLTEGDPPLLPPLEDSLMRLMVNQGDTKDGERFTLRNSWMIAPWGQDAPAGSKQALVSDIRSKRKERIANYMANLQDENGNAIFPGFKDNIKAWQTRREGTPRVPEAIKRDGKEVKPPIKGKKIF